jgi:hypothetical protein
MVVKIDGGLRNASKRSSPEAVPYSYVQWWLRPKAHDRPPIYWYLTSRIFALAIRVLPRRSRFGASTVLARMLTPLIHRTSWYRVQRKLRLDGVNDIALYYILSIMTHSGALFDPAFHLEGAENLNAALKRGQGILLVAPHALLSVSAIRYLYDVGCVPTVISTAPSVGVYGTRLAIRTLQPSPTFMIGLRSILRDGGMICAMVDGKRAGWNRNTEFSTVEGPMYINDALIRFAIRCNASVVFLSVRMDQRRRIVLTFGASATGPGSTVDEIRKDCIAFMQAHVAAVASASGV